MYKHFIFSVYYTIYYYTLVIIKMYIYDMTQTKWGGRRDRTRVVLRAADDGGAACPHLVAAEPCAPHSYSWHVAPWDDCQPLGRYTVQCAR